MPEEERINFDPKNLLPREVWLEPPPKDWEPPIRIYTGSVDNDPFVDNKPWYDKY